MRILGVDIGERRMGIAISDETSTIARGMEIISISSVDDGIRRIEELVSENSIEEIVVGLPLNMNGSVGLSARKAIDFANRLKEELFITVVTFDERLTTRQGENIMLQADMSRSKRKEKIDRLAAQIMLQAYLDSRKKEKER
jgi:putative Holliday junction resolvase